MVYTIYNYILTQTKVHSKHLKKAIKMNDMNKLWKVDLQVKISENIVKQVLGVELLYYVPVHASVLTLSLLLMWHTIINQFTANCEIHEHQWDRHNKYKSQFIILYN
jgi:hypothetical protein